MRALRPGHANGAALVPDRHDLYLERPLTEGFPGLETLGMEYRDQAKQRESVDLKDVQKTLTYLSRLIDLDETRRIAVIGCGHRPKIIRLLRELGHDAVGIEPVESYVEAARAYLGRDDAVMVGAAEAIPLPDDSVDVVLFEDVLEHVDSVSSSLREIHRVTRPGGIAYVKTNTKLHLSPTGRSQEFAVRFYNWLPDLVKESYVHQHLHFQPSLANYSTRPAVHWFDYAELCQAGREAGFARFYSLLDVVDRNDPSIRKSRFRQHAIELCKYHPWARALALTQVGGYVFMWKRPR